MLAILAMDSYNRGYDQGLDVVAAGGSATQIGTATIGNASSTLASSPEVQAGFYAAAYTWNGQTVISYRGTNTDSMLSLGADILNGWMTGAGVAVTQASRRKPRPPLDRVPN